MVTCYLGVGSNLGNRERNIRKAISKLKKIRRIKVEKVSRVYQTLPVGRGDQRKFLNAAIRLRTDLAPMRLLKKLKALEASLGRKKTFRFGPRVIDLDILLYSDRVINRKKLTVPHPRMFERIFVLKPLAQVLL